MSRDDQLRSEILRVASELPKGDPTRKALLSALRTASAPRYVVVDEGILGAIMGRDIQVLATDVHHTHTPALMPMPMKKDRMRDATPEDFKKFRVMVPPELRAASKG